MKIGVVGSGIAGLVAGWLFSKDGHQVVLFEKNPQPGLSGSGIESTEIENEIDVPLRLFNAKHWRRLNRIYEELAIETEPVSIAQSFSNSSGESYLSIDMQSLFGICLLYTSPSPRDATLSRMPSSA